jgi:FixJ family two-component response regulator
MHPSAPRLTIFSARGYSVHTFESAEDFLQSAHQDDSSCVVADVQMSGMSGSDLLTHLRTRGSDVPFIFITAFPDESVRVRALKAGAICFLSKPFAGPVLINYLEVALNQPPGGAGK